MAIHQVDNMYLVIIAKDAAALKQQQLVAGTPTSISYAGERSQALLEEDKSIAVFPIKVREQDITIIPIDKVLQ